MDSLRLLSEFIHNNNVIDGKPSETVDVIYKLLTTTKRITPAFEAKYPSVAGQYAAYAWMVERVRITDGITFNDVRAIHYKLDRNREDRGAIRTESKIVRAYECPDPVGLGDVVKKFDYLLTLCDGIIQSGDVAANNYFWYVHNVFECMQPFRSDNGRVGRLMFNMLRLRHFMDISNFDVDTVTYYNAIESFHSVFGSRYAYKPEGNRKLGTGKL